MEKNKMAHIVTLIHFLDANLDDMKRYSEIKFYRDNGRITTEEAVELILEYNVQLNR